MLYLLERLILKRGKTGMQHLHSYWRNSTPTILNEWFLNGLVHIQVDKTRADYTPHGPADVYHLHIWVYKLLVFVSKWDYDDDSADEYARGVLWDPG